jgi:hypothetical protein
VSWKENTVQYSGTRKRRDSLETEKPANLHGTYSIREEKNAADRSAAHAWPLLVLPCLARSIVFVVF